MHPTFKKPKIGMISRRSYTGYGLILALPVSLPHAGGNIT